MRVPELPSPHDYVISLLDDVRALDVECLTLDFVEQRLGRLYFQDHWEKKTDEEHARNVKAWLESIGQDSTLTEDIVVELQRLYRVKAEWPR